MSTIDELVAACAAADADARAAEAREQAAFVDAADASARRAAEMLWAARRANGAG